ncbi:hypothetical protein CNY89_21270, partial [Amaricoccus sp. HAR-UPW-R2A-40]
DALLSPWKDMSPDHDLKSYLTAKINALYGHPRIGRYKAVWNETSAAAQAIFQAMADRRKYPLLSRRQ